MWVALGCASVSQDLTTHPITCPPWHKSISPLHVYLGIWLRVWLKPPWHSGGRASSASMQIETLVINNCPNIDSEKLHGLRAHVKKGNCSQWDKPEGRKNYWMIGQKDFTIDMHRHFSRKSVCSVITISRQDALLCIRSYPRIPLSATKWAATAKGR